MTVNYRSIMPKAVTPIMQKLHQAGFRVFIVGGFVRDAMLNKRPKDVDLVTDAQIDRILEIFGRKSRRIGRRFPIVHVDIGGNNVVEISSFPKPNWSSKWLESKDNQQLKMLSADAKRRDFSINAMYVQYPSYKLYDPLAGKAALDRKMIEVIGDMHVRYDEDPVRLIRAIRLEAKLGFSQQQGFMACLRKKKRNLGLISQQRLFLEFMKLMQNEHTAKSLKLLLNYRIIHLFIDLPSNESVYFKKFTKAYSDLALQGRYQSASLLFAGLLWIIIKPEIGGTRQSDQNKLDLPRYLTRLLQHHLKVQVPRRLQEMAASIWLMILLVEADALPQAQLENMPLYSKAKFILSIYHEFLTQDK
tara:strand:- start:2609 stop:3688 length:1080 start_codon:yes stop_codon:yes gene_type:complete